MNAAISRMRCTNLLAQVSDDNIAAVDAVLAVIVAGQVRTNDSPECDGSAPPPIGEDCTAPTSAGRPEPSPSAPVFFAGDRVLWADCVLDEPHRIGTVERYCDEHSGPRVKLTTEWGSSICVDPTRLHRATSATSSGRVTGQQTPGTSTAKTSRDNAPVAAGEASPAESKGTRSFEHDDRVYRLNDWDCKELGRVVGTSLDDDGYGALLIVEWQAGESTYQTHVEPRLLMLASEAKNDCHDFDLDAATAEAETTILAEAAEALAESLRAVTEQPAPDWQPVPGEQVEVVEAVGSKTGKRVAIGTYRGEESDEGPAGGVWRLVEVHGVVRRFRAVGRVG